MIMVACSDVNEKAAYKRNIRSLEVQQQKRGIGGRKTGTEREEDEILMEEEETRKKEKEG